MNRTYKVMSSIVGLAAVAAFMAAPLAYAEDNSAKSVLEAALKAKVQAALPVVRPMPNNNNVSVMIGQGGKVEVHGATVTTVAANSFTATTVWGSSSLTWTVNMNSATQLTDKDGKGADAKHRGVSISDIQVGHKVDWNGQLDTSTSGLTVAARVVNDRSAVVVPAPNVKDIFQGTLQSVAASSTLPTSFLLKVGNTPYTVNVTTSTQVINAAFAATTLSTFQSGDTVRVFGSANTNSTIDALIVRDASR